MKENEQEQIEQLLRNALPPPHVRDVELHRDLWPAMLARLDAPTAAVPWFDWAVLAAIIICFVFFPAAIPVLLYHL